MKEIKRWRPYEIAEVYGDEGPDFILAEDHDEINIAPSGCGPIMVKRWDALQIFEGESDGDEFVIAEDHDKIVAELQAENAKLKKALSEIFSAKPKETHK